MSKNIITLDYQGISIGFTEAGWFNATAATGRYGKRPNDWLSLPETERYIEALCRKYKTSRASFIKTRRGGNNRTNTRKSGNGGTWLHPKLAVRFAQWLDIDFAIWCDETIDSMIRGTHQHFDWRRERSIAAASYKVVGELLKVTREAEGKPVDRHIFMNEARMINSFISGKFEAINRDELTSDELDLLGRLEVADAAFIGQGLDYQTRKKRLAQIADDWRASRRNLKAA
jgi:hypothetical protein